MYRVLVSETVTTPKDHGTPGRAIAWCRQQDLLGGRGEKPRRLDFTFKIFILTPGRTYIHTDNSRVLWLLFRGSHFSRVCA